MRRSPRVCLSRGGSQLCLRKLAASRNNELGGAVTRAASPRVAYPTYNAESGAHCGNLLLRHAASPINGNMMSSCAFRPNGRSGASQGPPARALARCRAIGDRGAQPGQTRHDNHERLERVSAALAGVWRCTDLGAHALRPRPGGLVLYVWRAHQDMLYKRLYLGEEQKPLPSSLAKNLANPPSKSDATL